MIWSLVNQKEIQQVRMSKRNTIITSLTVLLLHGRPPMQKMRPEALPGRTPAPVRASAGSNLLKLDYEGSTVWLDCAKRGLIKFATTSRSPM